MFSDDIIDSIKEYTGLDLPPEEIKDYVDSHIRRHTFVDVIYLLSQLDTEDKIKVLINIEDPYYFEKALFRDKHILNELFYLLLEIGDKDRLDIIIKRLDSDKITEMLLYWYKTGQFGEIYRYVSQNHPHIRNIYPLLVLIDDTKQLDKIIESYSDEELTDLAITNTFIYPRFDNYKGVLNSDRKTSWRMKIVPYLLSRGASKKKVLMELFDHDMFMELSDILKLLSSEEKLNILLEMFQRLLVDVYIEPPNGQQFSIFSNAIARFLNLVPKEIKEDFSNEALSIVPDEFLSEFLIFRLLKLGGDRDLYIANLKERQFPSKSKILKALYKL